MSRKRNRKEKKKEKRRKTRSFSPTSAAAIDDNPSN